MVQTIYVAQCGKRTGTIKGL